VGGEPVSFPSRRAALLIYSLALVAPASLTTEQLTERLWPESGRGQHALEHRLRTELHVARRALGAEGWRLERNGISIRFRLSGAAFDLADARAKAKAALFEGELSKSRSQGLEALEALQLPLLPDWPFADWLQEERHECEALAFRLALKLG
jgi:DNA-binding SARP family transcriptional activator